MKKLEEENTSGQEAREKATVSESMVRLLEEEAQSLRERFTKERTQRVQAEATLSDLEINHKHLQRKLEDTERRLQEAEARVQDSFQSTLQSLSGPGYGDYGSGSYGSSWGSAAAGSGSGSKSSATASVYDALFGMPSSASGRTSSYGGYGSGGYGSSGPGLSETDYMRDARLAEERAR